MANIQRIKKSEKINLIKWILKEYTNHPQMRTSLSVVIKLSRSYDVLKLPSYYNYLMLNSFRNRYYKLFPNENREKNKDKYYGFGLINPTCSPKEWIDTYNMINFTKPYNPNIFQEVRIKFLQDWLEDLTSGNK
jgi:hypothetical protein